MQHTLSPVIVHHGVTNLKKKNCIPHSHVITFKTILSMLPQRYPILTSAQVHLKEKITLQNKIKQQNLNQTCMDFCQQLLMR